MPKKFFKNKYRVGTIRLKNWDYSKPGIYFVTICTKNRKRSFGNVAHGRIRFTELGRVANRCWSAIPDHFPFVKLDEFIVMPDHVHGIIIIRPWGGSGAGSMKGATIDGGAPNPGQWQPNRFGPQSKNLGSIVRGFKVGVKKWATMNRVDFCWQSLYHERILRNNASLHRVRRYILNNPSNWSG